MFVARAGGISSDSPIVHSNEDIFSVLRGPRTRIFCKT